MQTKKLKKFEIGEKVIIFGKSTGRHYLKAMPDVRHKIKTKGTHYPVGWITEIREAYIVITYMKGGSGTDYYLEKDLGKIKLKFLEDDLFEI